MIPQIKSTSGTDWGLFVIFKKNLFLDDNNVFETVNYVLDRCQENGKKHVLIDQNNTTHKISVFKQLEIAELLQKRIPGVKIAFIAPALIGKEYAKTMETFAVNRSVYVRYFPDKDTALKWLIGQKV